MSVEAIARIIVDQLFGGDDEYLPDAMECAKSIVEAQYTCNS